MDYKEVAANAKKLKKQVAEQAGVKANQVNDKNLLEAQKMLEGAKHVDAAGGDPTKVEPTQLKALASGPVQEGAEPTSAKPVQKEKPEDLNRQQKIAMAIVQIAPTLLGYALGGDEGGAIGANVSLGAMKQMGEQEKANAMLAQQKDLKQMEINKDLAVAGERAQERAAAAAATAEQRRFNNTLLGEREADRKMTLAEKKAAEAEKLAFSKTVEGKIAHLSKEKQDSVFKAKEALQAVQGMAQALHAGDNTFSIIGDNEFTRNSAWFDEALGRMQSGGAITVDEIKNFKKLRPRATDSSEMQRKKLVELEKTMTDRLKIMGFQPEELGLNSGATASLFSQQAGQQVAGNPAIPAAAAAPLREKPLEQMNPQELEAHNKKLRAMLGGK